MNDSLRACGNYVKHAGVLVAGAILIALSGCASINLPERQPISLEQIVAMSKEGKDAAAIIREIRESRTTYDVMASQYAKLSRDGVPDEVIDFMQHGQLKMAERAGRRSAYDDLWITSRYGWVYGGPWSPRAYYLYANGRPFTRYW